jgi:hypothetical protein
MVDVLQGGVALACITLALRWAIQKLSRYESETCIGVAAIMCTRIVVDLYVMRSTGQYFLWVDVMLLSLGASWMVSAPSWWSVGYAGLYFAATLVLGVMDVIRGPVETRAFCLLMGLWSLAGLYLMFAGYQEELRQHG